MTIEQLIGAFLSVGGIGFMNFLVADRLGTIELYEYTNAFVIGYSLLWSIPDYFIYTFFLWFIKNYVHVPHSMYISIALLITLCISYGFTLVCAWPLNKTVRFLYGHIGSGLSSSYGPFGDILKSLLSGTSSKVLIYLYTIDHKEIDCGYLETVDFNKDGHPKFELSNFDDVSYPTSYTRVRSWLVDKKYNAYQYIDIDSNLLVIVFKING